MGRTSAREKNDGFLVASLLENFSMEGVNNAGLGVRRNEDIALDLLKFVAGTAGIGRTATPVNGF